MIREKVRKSIARNLLISILSWDAQTISSWCPIVFDIFIDSKTPARIKLVSLDYLLLCNDIPVQSGYWKTGMTYESSGYTVQPDAIVITGNSYGHFKVALNPVKLGRFPSNHDRWGMKGVAHIDTGYGQIHLPFERVKVSGDIERLISARAHFIKNFPLLRGNDA